MANLAEKSFGEVVLFNECPVCHEPVKVQVLGSIADPEVDLTGKDVGQAMGAISSVTCEVTVTALVLRHDCREVQQRISIT